MYIHMNLVGAPAHTQLNIALSLIERGLEPHDVKLTFEPD
jgi:hypothetical protein